MYESIPSFPQPDLVAMGSRKSGSVIGQDFTMADTQCLDPALLAERQRYEKTELDELGNREVAVQLLPEGRIGNIGIPDDRAGVRERHFLPLGELIRALKIEELIVILFRQSLPSSLDGSLHASIFAVDRFRHINPAHFLEFMIDDAVPKR
jgi:hypothetical protein